jgi:hypothetical protein
MDDRLHAFGKSMDVIRQRNSRRPTFDIVDHPSSPIHRRAPLAERLELIQQEGWSASSTGDWIEEVPTQNDEINVLDDGVLEDGFRSFPRSIDKGWLQVIGKVRQILQRTL